MNLCKLCLEPRKFIKAHAIPEAFFRELRADGDVPLLVSGRLGYFPKRAPIGVYDQEMLCKECEPKFGMTDDYGIEVFLKTFDELFLPRHHAGGAVAFESTAVDSSRLLRFLVAILWRAAVSSHPFYAKVDLGSHEPLAKAAIATPDKALSMVFDAVLSRWREERDVPTTAMLDPRREKWFGVNAYRLYLGETVAYVKVDQQPFPSPLRKVSLRSAPPVVVIARTMSESKDFRALKHTAKKAHENRLSFGRHKRA